MDGTKVRGYVYASHFLSAWGDRMWQFGVGMFMVIIAPNSLRLTAVYGLSMGTAILLFGAHVGNMVDKIARLTAARLTLIIQNLSVCVCAAIIYVVIIYKPEITDYWPGEGLLILCYAGIILVAIISSLASTGNTIAVERDWIAEICGKDDDMLASMTATMKGIDLTTNIVAPIATGQIMAYAGVEIGALFIGGWNIVSVFVEYYLLWKVYTTVPALRTNKNRSKNDDDGDSGTMHPSTPDDQLAQHLNLSQSQSLIESCSLHKSLATETTPLQHSDTPLHHSNTPLHHSNTSLHHSNTPHRQTSTVPDGDILQSGNLLHEESLTNTSQSKYEQKHLLNSHLPANESQDASIEMSIRSEESPGTCSCTSCTSCSVLCSGFMILVRGWKTYMSYDVAFAGLALSCLYMTVLGFDNITVGYAYTQGVNESIMGILMAAGAGVGIIGTILYPRMRKWVGLVRTGLFGLFLQITISLLCVVSIWMPGSPFDPLFKNSNDSRESNASTVIPSSAHTADLNITLKHMFVNDLEAGAISSFNETVIDTEATRSQPMISIILMLTGIVGARCGLWITDLTVTQLFLGSIHESERGVVLGVQTSLNQLMDMLKFIMVVIAPEPEVFGILVLISFGFLCCGWLLYARYARSVRGHLFHFNKLLTCRAENYNKHIYEPIPDFRDTKDEPERKISEMKS